MWANQQVALELPAAPLDSASAFQFAAPPLGAPHWALPEATGPVVAEHLGRLLATEVVFPAAPSGFAFPGQEAEWHLSLELVWAFARTQYDSPHK